MSGPAWLGVLANTRIVKTRTNVPTTSVMTFQNGDRTVAEVEKTFVGASSCSSNCFL